MSQLISVIEIVFGWLCIITIGEAMVDGLVEEIRTFFAEVRRRFK